MLVWSLLFDTTANNTLPMTCSYSSLFALSLLVFNFSLTHENYFLIQNLYSLALILILINIWIDLTFSDPSFTYKLYSICSYRLHPWPLLEWLLFEGLCQMLHLKTYTLILLAVCSFIQEHLTCKSVHWGGTLNAVMPILHCGFYGKLTNDPILKKSYHSYSSTWGIHWTFISQMICKCKQRSYYYSMCEVIDSFSLLTRHPEQSISFQSIDNGRTMFSSPDLLYVKQKYKSRMPLCHTATF